MLPTSLLTNITETKTVSLVIASLSSSMSISPNSLTERYVTLTPDFSRVSTVFFIELCSKGVVIKCVPGLTL